MRAFATLVLLAACAIDACRAVSNGVQASAGEFPYVVSVGVNGTHKCGGFIYSENYVITTASCVFHEVPSHLTITAGTASLILPDPHEQIEHVYSVVYFESYNYETDLHDIAILEAARPLTFDSYVHYIAIYSSDSSPATVMGWGSVVDNGVGQTKLRAVNVTVPADCSAGVVSSLYNAEFMICTGGSAVDVGGPCSYDEGSPLVQNGKVVGIVSLLDSCSGPDFPPALYTRLSAYEPWMLKNAGPQPGVQTTR